MGCHSIFKYVLRGVSFLGIDLGTGGVRCLLVNEEGSVLSEISKPLNRVNLSAHSGESMQDPRDWIVLLESALDELFSVPSCRHLLSVSVDSTSGTVLPVDRTGENIGPALMHNDMRSIHEVEWCNELFEDGCSPTFSLPKILWMQKNWSLSEEVLYHHATDFLNARLCGSIDLPTDFTNAMKSGVNLETQTWPDKLSRFQLPAVVAPGQVIGEISHSYRSRWSLTGPCLMVSGATDSNAAFYASGAGEIGDWSSTIGTTLAVKGISSQKISDTLGRIYCHRHPDGAWMPGGASNAGGEILKSTYGVELTSIENEASNARCEPLLVYPSIRKGERLPLADPKFMPFGQKSEEHKIAYFLGCIEGIAFVEKMTYDLLKSLGAEVGNRVYATGGATNSQLGLQVRADVLGRTLCIPKHPNSAMGAAILASAGYFERGVGEMSAELVKISKTVEPRGKLNEARNQRMEKFRQFCSETD